VSDSRIAIVFPGQGSQKPGMCREIHDAFSEASAVFHEVTEATGLDLRTLCFGTDEETLRQTQNAQLALFTVSVATFRALGPAPDCVAMAGHSVGEYAALVCAGALSVADGARLVQRRGDLMARSGALRPGAMSAVLGLEDGVVEGVCQAVTTGDRVVVVANYNCPGQVVISGDPQGVEEACRLLKEAGAKRCLPLNVSGAFHSPLMKEAATAMGEALKDVRIEGSRCPVISNVTAMPGEDWPRLLERQLESPVLWTDSVREMLDMGAIEFLECGSGDVLSGLLKRISSDASGLAVNSVEAVNLARMEYVS
jgi:[acyl-carrier-protein] S-malonyltransferase